MNKNTRVKRKNQASLGAFSAAVSSLRAALGKSQEEMARACGLSLRGYLRWERGESVPGGDNLRKLQAMGLALPDSTRPEDAARAQLHQALDLILNSAPETIQQKVADLLTRYAGQYSK